MLAELVLEANDFVVEELDQRNEACNCALEIGRYVKRGFVEQVVRDDSPGALRLCSDELLPSEGLLVVSLNVPRLCRVVSRARPRVRGVRPAF